MIQSQCAFSVWREELKVWPMALGQKQQDVMGTDPRPRRLPATRRAAQSGPCRGTRPRILAGGILTPDTSQGQVLQPSWMTLQPRPAGTVTILTHGMLKGLSPLSLLSCKAKFCRVTPWLWVLCHNELSSLGLQQLSFPLWRQGVLFPAVELQMLHRK